MSFRPRRRFLRVGDRRVHYLRAGEGPPAVLIHSSPANARLLLPEIEHVAGTHTVFAFDTPGFGLSDALPLPAMCVADLAHALADTLDALGLPRCPMFGTHTGAAIVLEFASLYPDRVTGVVLDGVPAFTDAEFEALFGEYFRKIEISDLGSQYAAVWTRFRDQSVWFPWSARAPDHINEYDLGAPESTHLWASMYFEAMDSYIPAYRAALRFGCGGHAIRAAAGLKVPAIYTATNTDMLFDHMARLDPRGPGQEIRRIGTSHEAKRALIVEGFLTFGSLGTTPPDRDAIGSSRVVARQFVEGRDGRQLHLRYCGNRDAPPVLLLHDAPGSSARLEALIAALAGRHFVVAPDLPGCGLSDAFAPHATIAAYAASLADLLDHLRLHCAAVVGIGFGASAAIGLATHFSERVGSLALCGVLLPEAAERAQLAAHYAPDIAIAADGSHWYKTWLMLRDSLIWWPWYDRRRAALRRVPADFGAAHLHAWTCDVMASRTSYADVIHAALAHDAAAALGRIEAPILCVSDTITPLAAAYDAKLRAVLPRARTLASGGLADLAAGLLAFFPCKELVAHET